MVTLVDARVDTHASVDTLHDSLREVEAEAVGDTRGDAHALVNTLAYTLIEVEAPCVAYYLHLC